MNIIEKIPALLVRCALTLCVAAAALFTAERVEAQVPTYAPQTLYSSVYITTATATNVAKVIDTSHQNTAAVQLTQTGDGASTANVIYLFVYSVDGVNYDLVNTKVVSVPLTGATTTTAVTNLSSFGAGYIKLLYATNSSGVNVTNTVTYGVKMSSP